MKRFLTTGFLGAILGIVIGGAPADASLISRSFLDQALTDYATNTALDLKANKADVTDLSDKIGTLPSGYMHPSKGLAFLVPSPAYTYPTTIGDSIFQLYSGTLGLSGLADAVYHGNAHMGQTDTTLQVKGLRQITDEIGTLPSGDMYPPKGLAFLLPDTEYYTYPTSIGDFMGQMYNGYLGLTGLAQAVYHGNAFMGQTDTALQVKGLRQITDEIGTLPSGNFPEIPGYDLLFSELNQPLTYPTSLAELITAIYGNSETGVGLLAAIITGFHLDIDGDGSPERIGLIPNLQRAAYANDLANVNTAKIGDLPTPDTTVAGMMGHPVLLNREQTIIPLYDLILWGSNGQIVMNPITGMTMPFPLLGLHDITAKVNKIGDLPTEYATVGAALTAMDAKIDARELPSTSDDGQYVLSAKKVGDTITYTWVRMDLTSEEQAQ